MISVNLFDFLAKNLLISLIIVFFQMSDVRPDDTEAEGQGTTSLHKNQPKQLMGSGPKISEG